MKAMFRWSSAPSMVAFLLLISLTGCDGFGTESVATTSGFSAAIDLARPPGLPRLRDLDEQALVVEITLDGNPVAASTSDDGAWHASFELPDDNGDAVSVLIATWIYDVDGTPITLAQSFPVEVTLDSSREIVINRYDTRFDNDIDGAENLDELVSGSSPLDPDDRAVAPSTPDSVDCRSFPREGFPPPVELPPIVRLREVALDSNAITPNSAEHTVYYAAFLPEVRGNLRIQHTGGSPVDTDAIIHLRQPFEENPSLSPARYNVDVYDTRDQPRDDQRAVIPPPPTTSLGLKPGFVYCYVLFTRAGDGSEASGDEVLTDTVIEIEFIPE